MPGRQTSTVQDFRAGCYICHDGEAHWWAKNAQGVAAQHHDKTGHPVWVEVVLNVWYGDAETYLKTPEGE